MKQTLSILFLLLFTSSFSQTLPESRSVEWTLAGLRDPVTSEYVLINMEEKGATGDGTIPNDSIMTQVLSNVSNSGAILSFPAGNFLFNHTINLPSNVIIRGQGADKTFFTMDLGGKGHSINIKGYPVYADTSSMTFSASRDSNFINILDATKYAAGDWIQIIQNDSDLITSSWGLHSVGQIVKIKAIFNNNVILESPLRLDYDIVRAPYILRIVPAEHIGIECIKIRRLDNTAPEQSSNINLSYAVNCYMTGIESENCTFSHLQANYSSNLYVSSSYFHDAFEYGGGGRGYGIMLQFTTNECRIENNIFKHLRHSMILQAGANGNVFAYNYSLDPYWDSAPNNAAGDIVLHGNYVYANLIEQNICQNIVIDDSHGPNGPFNTFFRNRAEGYGIFFSADNSPFQNLMGNEIPNTGFPYYLINYTIRGTQHFIHSNNNKGTIDPSGTDELVDSTYAYINKPEFITEAQWSRIGPPNKMGMETIPAYDRYHSGAIFNGICGQSTVRNLTSLSNERVMIFPNPVQDELKIESALTMSNVSIINALGQRVYFSKNLGWNAHIKTSDWADGVYFILIEYSNGTLHRESIVKSAQAK